MTLTSKTSTPEPETFEIGEELDMGELANPFECTVIAIAGSAGDPERPNLQKIRVRAIQENYVGWDLYADNSKGTDGLDKAPHPWII